MLVLAGFHREIQEWEQEKGGDFGGFARLWKWVFGDCWAGSGVNVARASRAARAALWAVRSWRRLRFTWSGGLGLLGLPFNCTVVRCRFVGGR